MAGNCGIQLERAFLHEIQIMNDAYDFESSSRAKRGVCHAAGIFYEPKNSMMITAADPFLTKPIQAAAHCHLNAMVADTQKWEQVVVFILDTHPGVRKWVKNERLGFFIPYRRNGLPARYVPDFIAVTDTDQNVIVEIKGQVTDNADAKAKAALRWTKAVTRLGERGAWHYLLVTDPGRLGLMLNAFASAAWDQGEFRLT